jgi:NADP-reducing hydrogenase subunit HndC
LITYSIDPEKCKGCTLCTKKCPADAIVGSPKNPHYIIAEKCVGCGTCMDVCRPGAILKK